MNNSNKKHKYVNRTYLIPNIFIAEIFTAIYLVTILLYCNSSEAALIVNRSIITFDNPAQSREDVVVLNSSLEDNLYLKVEPFVVLNPGTNEQELTPLVVGDNPEFLVTPNRLITPPEGRNLVRFLNLNTNGDKERIYRVNVVPVTPPVELQATDPDSVISALEIVVAYQILIIIPPTNPHAEVTMERNGQLMIFRNPGNSNYLLTDGEQCNPANPEECIRLEDHRVYPGNIWTKDLPFDGPFTYKVRTKDGLTIEYFD
jgi:P pilus assembly chaperone PapD